MNPSRCPTCGQPTSRKTTEAASTATPDHNKAFPFCSPRCQLIDLGRWLGEEFRIPEGVGGDVSGGGTEGVPAPGEDQVN